jgi:hypothetical protein
MDNSQEQNGAIPVRVASYSNTTWQGSWRQRSRAFWGTGFFGLAWGGGVGALIGGTMLAVSAITPVGLPIMILGCAAAGGGIGLAIADSVGAASGAVGAGLGEWESRFKQMMVEAGLFKKEMVQKEPISAALNRTEMVDTPEEVNLRGQMFKTIVNWPAMVSFVSIGAAVGSLFGAFGLFAIPASITGMVVGPVVNTAVAAALGAGVGGIFGVNSPVISNHFNNFFSRIFSGEAFGNKPSPVIVPTPDLAAPAPTPPTEREYIMSRQSEFTKRIASEREAAPSQAHIVQ